MCFTCYGIYKRVWMAHSSSRTSRHNRFLFVYLNHRYSFLIDSHFWSWWSYHKDVKQERQQTVDMQLLYYICINKSMCLCTVNTLSALFIPWLKRSTSISVSSLTATETLICLWGNNYLPRNWFKNTKNLWLNSGSRQYLGHSCSPSKRL